MSRYSLAALLCTLTFAGAANAAVLKESNLSTVDAQKLAAATVAACQAKGYNVSAAVVDRAGLLKAIKDTGKFDIGGLEMTFGPQDNEGLDKVFMTVIQPDGSFKAVEKLIRVSAN